MGNGVDENGQDNCVGKGVCAVVTRDAKRRVSDVRTRCKGVSNGGGKVLEAKEAWAMAWTRMVKTTAWPKACTKAWLAMPNDE